MANSSAVPAIAGGTPGKKKPLITANMVTFARVLAMPLVFFFFYEDGNGPAIALTLGALVGATDFVDGYLARKHGPTLLGGLLDPIADKVFIAIIYVPFAHNNYVPVWILAALFSRELLITALRTAYLLRGVTMRTSYLGKVKTWFQMQGAGMIYAWIIFGHEAMWIPLLVMVVASFAVLIVFFAIKRTVWRGMVMWAMTSVIYVAIYDFGQDVAIAWTVVLLLAPTWLSAVDYFVDGVRQLRLTEGLFAADRVRIVASLALPAAITALLYLDIDIIEAWALTLILGIELAVGGLDNLLAAHKATASAKAWGARTFGTVALLGAAIAAHLVGAGEHVDALLWVAVGISFVGGALEFWRGADYYLDKRVRAAGMPAMPGDSFE